MSWSSYTVLDRHQKEWDELDTSAVVPAVLLMVCVCYTLSNLHAFLETRAKSIPKHRKACGSWPSPVTASYLTDDCVKIIPSELRCDPDGKHVYWVEERPTEGGRHVSMKWIGYGCLKNSREDETPEGYGARTRVHEYGGGSHEPYEGGVIFSNTSDQQLYQTIPDNEVGGKEVMQLTKDLNCRYADGAVDTSRARRSHLGSWIDAEFVCVRENHAVDTVRD
mmetsp:Transcript_4952/g.10758  ORF Transcript_4952/g.10758 Transcript_4952/m.10758 type:complete len:222 (-) Transcript_4952:73-738(-)